MINIINIQSIQKPISENVDTNKKKNIQIIIGTK